MTVGLHHVHGVGKGGVLTADATERGCLCTSHNVCARACMRACVCGCVYVCEWVYAGAFTCGFLIAVAVHVGVAVFWCWSLLRMHGRS